MRAAGIRTTRCSAEGGVPTTNSKCKIQNAKWEREPDDLSVSLVEEGEAVYNIRHRCFHFSRDVIHFARELKVDRLLFSILDQLIRSATSIGANVVEGRAGSSKKDLLNFLTIALKSANETKYWLCLLRDTTDADKGSVQNLLKEADEISKIIATIIINAKG